MNKFDPKTGVEDIQATINTLRHTEGCSGKVGAVGYCLGGMLAYLAATRTDADASVSYYGVNIQTLLGESRNIKQPLMLHIAGKDEFVKSEAQRQIVDGLKDNQLVTVHTYPQMDHAFARVGGAHYDHANAELANGRTATFFRQHLS
ncbi:MAG TPA: dienelactone hydrolase family protein [Rhizomicrobium sp.]|nr:dienelactone hydrolase family protein [Rhizomicrobium sp.]